MHANIMINEFDIQTHAVPRTERCNSLELIQSACKHDMSLTLRRTQRPEIITPISLELIQSACKLDMSLTHRRTQSPDSKYPVHRSLDKCAKELMVALTLQHHFPQPSLAKHPKNRDRWREEKERKKGRNA